MHILLHAWWASPTRLAPSSPPSLANTCIFSYMQGGPIQHAPVPPPPSLAHTCIFSYKQGGPVQHASPLPSPPQIHHTYAHMVIQTMRPNLTRLDPRLSPCKHKCSYWLRHMRVLSFFPKLQRRVPVSPPSEHPSLTNTPRQISQIQITHKDTI